MAGRVLIGALASFGLIAASSCRDAEGAIARDPGPTLPAEASSPTEPIAPPPDVAPPAPVPDPPTPEEIEQARQEAERAAFEARYPLHGVSFHFLTQIFAEPDTRSTIIGYLRRGAQVRLSRKQRGRGCTRGWHQLPRAGWVCHGRGVQIGNEPQTWESSPIAASREDDLPYAYALVTSESAPQYARIPSLDEEEEAARALTRIEAAEEAQERAAGLAAVAARAREVAQVDPAAAPADGETETNGPDGVAAPAPPGAQEDVGGTAHDDDDDGIQLPDFMRSRLAKGYYVSIDRVVESDMGRRFYRTVRGGFLRTAVTTAADPPTFRGVVLGGEWQLPVGFVHTGGTRMLRPAGVDVSAAIDTAGAVPDGQRPSPSSWVGGDRVRRGTAFLARGDRRWRGTRYVETGDGSLLPSARVVVVRRTARPEGVEAGERWILVDLSQQSLVAYEGDEPVFATLVSTGRDGFATPTGTFRIQSKHVSTTMDDEAAADGAYSIEDVPWTMYFQGNYALHGAFWHTGFGRVRSHGCVNLAPADARWLFEWAGPNVPAGWHGAFARRGNPGTRIVITP